MPSLKCCYFAKFPLLRLLNLDKFFKAIKTKQNLHVQTKVSIFKPSRQIPNAQRQRRPPRLDNRTVRSHLTTRALGWETQGPEPTGKPGPARRVRPGAECSMELERMGAGRSGSSGANGGDRAAARLSSRGFWARESPPGWGYRAGRVIFKASRRAARGPGGREGRASGAQPPAPESTFEASPTPHDKMATWAAGEPGRRGWGERGEGRRGRNKKAAPSGALRLAPEPAAAGGRGAPAENATDGGKGLTFSCRSRRRRPPWRIGPREAFTAGRPQARSGLSAGSLHTRGEKGRHVQRWEVQGGNPLVNPEAGAAGGNRKGPGPAQKSLPSGSLSGPRAPDEAAARPILASPQTRRLCALRS